MFPSAGVLPGARLVSPESASLFGFPYWRSGLYIDTSLQDKSCLLEAYGLSTKPIYCLHITLSSS